jgi:hypothetical protein
MNYILGSTLIALVLANNFAATAQRERPGVPVKIVERTIPVKIIDQANDFSEKGLPEPAIIADGRSDESAAVIAAKLSKYEDDSLSYLIAVLQKAGFYIIDKNKKILYQPTVDYKGMGLAFYDYEVVGMLKLSRAGYVTSVGKLADIIGAKLTPAEKQALGTAILQDLRTASVLEIRAEENTSNKSAQTKRFWARLMIETSKQFPQPVDLMTASPENAQLNVIQASLLLRRLTGDLIAFVTRDGASNRPFRTNVAGLTAPVQPDLRFLNASLSHPVVPADDCKAYDDNEGIVMDGAANGITTLHGKVLDAFAEEGSTLQKVGTGIGIANAVLGWAKLVAAASQMQGTITVEEPQPLIRTKSSMAPGERRLLTGKFQIKINDIEQLNCVRLTVNQIAGLDFNMPESGPLAEKPVSWELSGETSFFGQGSSQSGEYNQVVYLLPLDGANRDHHKQETDAKGESKIYLEGAKQKKDLNGQKVVPLPRKAVVRADVALKNMKDSKQEVSDIGNFGFGFATGGGLLGILGAIPEIGFRMKIPVTAVFVPVRDWTPCSADWGGWITAKREFHQTITIKSSPLANGNTTGDGVRRISRIDEADITLDPRKPEELQSRDPKPAAVIVRGKHSDVSDLYRGLEPCCGRTEGRFSTRIRKGDELEYNKMIRERVNVGYRGSERDYELEFSFTTTENLPAKRREFLEVLETNCELDKGYSKETDTLWSTGFGLVPGRYGQRLVNSEGEFLFGSKELTLPDGSKETWNWALARCSD